MVYIDTHVHIHPCFPLDSFFDAVEANFQAAKQSFKNSVPHTGCIFLTESRNADYFEKIRALTKTAGDSQTGNGKYRVTPTSEPCSLLVTTKTGFQIFLIAGRQLQTQENLEVLAVASNSNHRENAPLETLIKDIGNAGGLAIVPWGFGKWFGRRGGIIKKVIEHFEQGALFIGDNSGRPALISEPRLFRLARQKGMAILPGSDPLPFRREINRAGSFGLCLPATIAADRPAECIKKALRTSGLKFYSFGKLETLGKFVQNQLLMQIKKDRT